MKPGDDALLALSYPRPHLAAVRIRAVVGGSAWVEKTACSCGHILRPYAEHDVRSFIPLSALENLPAALANRETGISASLEKAGASAA